MRARAAAVRRLRRDAARDTRRCLRHLATADTSDRRALLLEWFAVAAAVRADSASDLAEANTMTDLAWITKTLARHERDGVPFVDLRDVPGAHLLTNLADQDPVEHARAVIQFLHEAGRRVSGDVQDALSDLANAYARQARLAASGGAR